MVDELAIQPGAAMPVNIARTRLSSAIRLVCVHIPTLP